MKRITFLFLVILTTMASMQGFSQKSDYLVVGSGGGIAGRWEFYKLTANGEVFYRVNLAADYNKIGKISKKETAALLDRAAALNMDSLEINQPGNMSYIIEYQSNKNLNRVIWGGNGGTEVPPQLTNFYHEILLILMKEK